MRSFNTAGPCIRELHYMLPAAERLPEAPGLVEKGQYFVVHAPRQTGKTTTLIALCEELNASGRFAALHFSCEGGEAVGDDLGEAQRYVLASIRLRAARLLPAPLRPPEPWPEATDSALLQTALSAWAIACPLPLVLVFDEIDALRGDSLRSVLRQLRAGFLDRPKGFPLSVILCGLRDVREYKAASGGDPSRLGTSSPFNIKVKSFRLGDFSLDEIRKLFAQHTAETGQAFTAMAIARTFELSGGQPWLVNALAREIVDDFKLPYSRPIEPAHVDEASERLILARATHLDSLVARLHEPRVQRIIEPILAGTLIESRTYEDDVEYVRALGLIAAANPTRIANPIYREVIARVLAGGIEGRVIVDRKRFITEDGRLDMERVLREFAAFWRLNGESLTEGVGYHEVAPQLVLMAYIQGIVNATGQVEREYGVGAGRIDLLVRWSWTPPGRERTWQKIALELKVWRPRRLDPLPEGIEQLESYLVRLGLGEGFLVIFDRRSVSTSETGGAALETSAASRPADLAEHVSPAGCRIRVLVLG
jgi:DNA polymerase III delta prime subunit